MGKWTIHRPPSQSKTTARRSPVSKATTTHQDRKPTRGRWIIHDPTKANPPTGSGFHFDGIEQTKVKRKVSLGERWTCDYGCKSFVWDREPEPGQFHAYDCPYWDHEGKELAPF